MQGKNYIHGRSIWLLFAAVALVSVMSVFAIAQPREFSQGTTTIDFAPGFNALINARGIEIFGSQFKGNFESLDKDAEIRLTGILKYKMNEGAIDKATRGETKGLVYGSGVLKLAIGNLAVEVKNFIFRIVSGAPRIVDGELIADNTTGVIEAAVFVNGEQITDTELPFFDFTNARLNVRDLRFGERVTLSNVRLTLNPTAAQRINQGLGLVPNFEAEPNQDGVFTANMEVGLMTTVLDAKRKSN